ALVVRGVVVVAHVIARLGVEVERAGVRVLVGAELERRPHQAGEEAAEALRVVEREQGRALVRDHEVAHAAALLVARDVVAVEVGLEAPHIVLERRQRGGGQEPRDDEELVLGPVLARERGRVEPIDRRVDLGCGGKGLRGQGSPPSRSTCTRFECSAGPPPMSVTRSSVSALTPRPPAWCLLHQIPSTTATPGRVSPVTSAVNRACPRALRTTTASPPRMARGAASAGCRSTAGPRCRRRIRSDWLNEEFRKNRLGGTMHWSG